MRFLHPHFLSLPKLSCPSQPRRPRLQPPSRMTLSIATTSAVETTSTTEAATYKTLSGLPSIPTFNAIAGGGGLAADTCLSASRRASFITFDYEAGNASAECSSIEPETGRLKTSNLDTYVCATFVENGQSAGTAHLVNCIQQNTDVGGDDIAYLRCDLNQGKIACTTPWNRESSEWMRYPDEASSVMTKLLVTPHNTWVTQLTWLVMSPTAIARLN